MAWDFRTGCDCIIGCSILCVIFLQVCVKVVGLFIPLFFYFTQKYTRLLAFTPSASFAS